MYKKTLAMVMGLSSLLYVLDAAAADTYFQAPPPGQNGAVVNGPSGLGVPPVSTTVVPPSDFAKQANQASSQNQAAAMQQLNQQLGQVPQNKPSAPANQNMQPTSPSGSTTMPTETQSMEMESAPAAMPQPVASTPPPPRPQPVQQQAAPAPAQSQVYTGFPTSSQPANTSGGQGSSSGGWNIKY